MYLYRWTVIRYLSRSICCCLSSMASLSASWNASCESISFCNNLQPTTIHQLTYNPLLKFTNVNNAVQNVTKKPLNAVGAGLLKTEHLIQSTLNYYYFPWTTCSDAHSCCYMTVNWPCHNSNLQPLQVSK